MANCKIHNCNYNNLIHKYGVMSEYSCPIDKDNYCLFHSHNKKWKFKNEFHKNFIELLNIISQLIKKGVKHIDYDFRNFVFIGEYYINDKTNILDYNPKLDGITSAEYNIIPEMPLIIIKDFIFNGNVSFVGSKFEDFIIFINTTFNEYVSFAKSAFNSEVVFKECVFNGVSNLSKCSFESTFYLHNSIVNDYFKFIETKFFNGFDFFKTNFIGQVDFSNSQIEETIKDFTTVISRVEFDTFIFNDVEIESGIGFLEVVFNGQCEFTNTSFSKTYHTNFYEIIVNDTIIFQGNENVKVFNHRVSFSLVNNELEGHLIFENVNISHIDTLDKNKLLKFEQENKVTIGKGCIKYRLVSDIIKINISKENHNILKEISTTFTNYFIHSNGFNLGVQFINKNINSLELYYYTDENITKKEFINRLKTTGNDFWGSELNNKSLVKKDFILIDTIISKMSVLLKIIFRKNIGLWSDKETHQLSKTIISSNQSITIINQSIQNTEKTFNINPMKIEKIENNGKMIIAETIKNLNFGDYKEKINETDFENFKKLISKLNKSEINKVNDFLEIIPTLSIKKKEKEKSNFKKKITNLFVKYSIPISQSVSADMLFEIIKQMIK